MTSAVSLKFRLQKTSQFFDRAAAKQIDPVLNRFLRWSGRDVRQAARRSLKLKRARLKDLPEDERREYRQEQKAYRDGKRSTKPRLPKMSAKPGEPPRLQFKPNPLRDGATGVLFTLSDDKHSVVVGPSPFGDDAAEKIEARNPFMVPAFAKVKPRMPDILRRAAN